MKITSNMKMTSNLKATLNKPNQRKHTKPTVQNLPNQTQQIKPTKPTKKAVQIKLFCASTFFCVCEKM